MASRLERRLLRLDCFLLRLRLLLRRIQTLLLRHDRRLLELKPLLPQVLSAVSAAMRSFSTLNTSSATPSCPPSPSPAPPPSLLSFAASACASPRRRRRHRRRRSARVLRGEKRVLCVELLRRRRLRRELAVEFVDRQLRLLHLRHQPRLGLLFASSLSVSVSTSCFRWSPSPPAALMLSLIEASGPAAAAAPPPARPPSGSRYSSPVPERTRQARSPSPAARSAPSPAARSPAPHRPAQ